MKWYDIPQYEGYYQISRKGDIRGVSRVSYGSHNKGKTFDRKLKGREIKQTVRSNGYKHVGLCKDGKTKQFLVHRLMAITFLDNAENLPQVNHIDGNKLNNDIKNLEWCDSSHNMKHAYDVIGIKPHALGRFGKDNNSSKKIKQLTMDGYLVKVWDSGMDAVRAGFRSCCISRCCQGISAYHKGYKWEYME